MATTGHRTVKPKKVPVRPAALPATLPAPVAATPLAAPLPQALPATLPQVQQAAVAPAPPRPATPYDFLFGPNAGIPPQPVIAQPAAPPKPKKKEGFFEKHWNDLTQSAKPGGFLHAAGSTAVGAGLGFVAGGPPGALAGGIAGLGYAQNAAEAAAVEEANKANDARRNQAMQLLQQQQQSVLGNMLGGGTPGGGGGGYGGVGTGGMDYAPGMAGVPAGAIGGGYGGGGTNALREWQLQQDLSNLSSQMANNRQLTLDQAQQQYGALSASQRQGLEELQAGFGGRTADQRRSAAELDRLYGERGEKASQLLEGAGEESRREINRTYDDARKQRMAELQTQLQQRGLGGTTVAGTRGNTLAAGVEQGRSSALAQLAEQIRQERVGQFERLSGERLTEKQRQEQLLAGIFGEELGAKERMGTKSTNLQLQAVQDQLNKRQQLTGAEMLYKERAAEMLNKLRQQQDANVIAAITGNTQSQVNLLGQMNDIAPATGQGNQTMQAAAMLFGQQYLMGQQPGQQPVNYQQLNNQSQYGGNPYV